MPTFSGGLTQSYRGTLQDPVSKTATPTASEAIAANPNRTLLIMSNDNDLYDIYYVSRITATLANSRVLQPRQVLEDSSEFATGSISVITVAGTPGGDNLPYSIQEAILQ